jgi:RNA polymerase sigma-70 factor (ECF subfamily)
MPAAVQRRALEVERNDAADAAIVSFSSLYDAHVDFVWRNLRRFGVAEPALEDALQDVFLVVHRRLAEFEGRSSISTWLFAIVRRVASEHRRKAARTAAHTELESHPQLCTRTTPVDSVEHNQAVQRLGQVLASLNESKREVFILIELEQIPGPEVARSLDINLNTMYTRLRAARAEFAREVERLRAKDAGRLR